MSDNIMLSPILCNLMVACMCLVMISLVICFIMSTVRDYKRDKREERKSAQDDEYHAKRMKNL